MNLIDLGEAVQRLWSKAQPKRPAPAGGSRAGAARSGRLEGCGLRGRASRPPEAELRLYHEMRCSFPILDVAITRLVQLCGHPRIEAPAAVRDDLHAWMERVPAGPGQRGLGSWLETHLDRMLLFGTAAGRIVLTRSRRDVYAVLNLDPREIRLEAGADPLSARVVHRPPGACEAVVLPPELTLLSLHAPQGSAHGTSLLRSLPFVAEACSIIENATAQVWQRMGAPSFHVSWEPDEKLADPQGTIAQGVTADLEQSFTEIMAARRHGEVKDFFTSGKISISAIGREGQIVALQEPFRVFMEQMVAVTGLPPWLLGLHWASTERLSVQQADLLVANIEAIRREAQPQVEYLLELRQRLRGAGGRFRVTWPPVNLRDATEQARAEAWREQGRMRRIENARRMWELGFWSQERAARDLDETLTGVARRLEAPPGDPPTLPLRLTPAVDD
jgi:hypothetical protein